MAIDMESFIGGENLKIATSGSLTKSVTLLPDPPRRERFATIVSVDDHLVEPPDAFDGRFAACFRDRAPRVVPTEDGGEAWLYDGKLLPNIGLNAVAGRPKEEHSAEPTRFEHMRRGAWDPRARIRDMDLDGVYASLCFPSCLVGFGGGRIQTITDDRELALAAVRAYNDWHLEAWAGVAPDRFIPCGITWLHDPELGAAEIRRNADRGFRALAFPESPHRLGLPSAYSSYWDPVIRACAETGTVLCLHVGSGGYLVTTDAPDNHAGALGVMFGMAAMMTCIDWVFSGYPARYPDLKICLSEGGIGWVAGVRDRLLHEEMKVGVDALKQGNGWDVTPREALARNFYFCFLIDPSSLQIRDAIGSDRIMFEVDYPHSDTNWPDTQERFAQQVDGLEREVIDRLAWRNASELFQHAVPKAIQSNPDAF